MERNGTWGIFGLILIFVLSCQALDGPADIKTIQQADCGWVGITQQQCLEKGCVWLEKFQGPWCQFENSPFIPPLLDIGLTNTTPEQQDVLQMCALILGSFLLLLTIENLPFFKLSNVNINYLAAGVVFIVAWITRYYKIEHPKEVVFDEFYFGAFANSYCNKTYVFDIHPPLAKLTHYYFGMLLGHECTMDFHAKDELADYASLDQYIHLRRISAFFGTLVVPIAFLLGRKIGLSLSTALLLSVFVLADSLLLSETRLILTDSQLFFYTVFAVYAAYSLWRSSSERSFWKWTFFTGVACGCAFAIKFTALATLAWIAFITFTGIFPNKPVSLFKCFVAGIIGIVVFVIPFYFHVQLGVYSSDLDWNIGPEYQQLLIGSPNYNKNAEPPFFLTHLVYLIRRMLEQNAASLGSHPYQSFWYQWVVGKGALLSYSEHDDANDWHGHIFIVSDLYICLAILAAIVLFIPLSLLLIRTRHYIQITNYEYLFVVQGWLFILGWAANVLPYALVERSTYSYHYLPGQFFGLLLVCLLVDFLPYHFLSAFIDDGERLKKSINRTRILLFTLISVVMLWHFYYFSCFSYGYGISQFEFLKRQWYITSGLTWL